MWFIIGVSVNVIGILLVIADAIYDAFTRGKLSEGSVVYQLAAMVIFILILIAFSLKTNGFHLAANVLVWIPAVPISIFYFYMLLFIILKPKF